MIELHSWATPNGRKVSILLEELGIPYETHPVDITAGQQHEQAFAALNPNRKIPVIVDRNTAHGEPLVLSESGAILLYLATKEGRFLPHSGPGHWQVVQWLMFQMGGVGPILGQNHHFRRYAPAPVPYAIDRFTTETSRLYGVLDHRLGEAEYLGGAYSIADMATFPWIARHEWQGLVLADYPNVARWFGAVSGRAAVQRGMRVFT